MLIEFSVKNFRSIKNKITFSLLATSDKSLDFNLIKNKTLGKDRLLKGTVIYGANASGKSNVILAFYYLKNLVMDSHKHQKGNKINFKPFRFDKYSISKPSEFEIVFIKDEIKYIYGLSLNGERVIKEYLYYCPRGKKALIFNREWKNNDYIYKFTIDKSEQQFISERTLENVLYLSSSTQLNYDETSKAFDWFKDNLFVIGPTDHPQLKDITVDMLQTDKEFKNSVIKALSEADLGIEDIFSSVKQISIEEWPSDLPMEIKDVITTLDAKKEGKPVISKVRVDLFHKIINKKGEAELIPLGFFDESEGTQRIFSLIGPWIDALKNGRILIVDELDTKLHHLLNVFLIKLFQDPTQNKKNAQLIFTTHNTNLLNLDLFRRDQIWFTEKNHENGVTELYSLVEFKPRKDKNIQNGYLAGRYGALPFIKDWKVLE